MVRSQKVVEEDDDADEQPEVYASEEERQRAMLRGRAILILSGPIAGGHMAICNELLNLHYTDSFQGEVTMLINSPGGSADTGWAIIDVMNFVRFKINTVCIGLAASMAADIFVNGDHRTMGEHSTLMIHPHSSMNVGGYHKLLANQKGDMIEHNRRIQHYVTNSKYNSVDQTETCLFKTLGEDLWLSPKEVLEHGLTDAIALSNKKEKRSKSPAVGARLVRETSSPIKRTKVKRKPKRK